MTDCFVFRTMEAIRIHPEPRGLTQETQASPRGHETSPWGLVLHMLAAAAAAATAFSRQRQPAEPIQPHRPRASRPDSAGDARPKVLLSHETEGWPSAPRWANQWVAPHDVVKGFRMSLSFGAAVVGAHLFGLSIHDELGRLSF